MVRSRYRRRAAGPLTLAVSLGINLFLAGWAVTQYLEPPAYSKPGVAPEVVAQAIARSLPAADGALLAGAFAAKKDTLDRARHNYLEALERLRQVIRAEHLDETALQDRMRDVRQIRQTERQIFSDTMLEVIPKMSWQGRQDFVSSHMGGHP
jgi:hypothetical protein